MSEARTSLGRTSLARTSSANLFGSEFGALRAFFGADLSGANLSQANLVEVGLSGATADENARLFGQLTGRKTLLKTDLKRIKALGFQIEQEQRVADMLKEVVGNVGNE